MERKVAIMLEYANLNNDVLESIKELEDELKDEENDDICLIAYKQ